MTDEIKIVRILARNVPHTQTQARRRRRVSHVSPSLQESDGAACSMRGGAILLKHKKTSLDNLRMSGSDL